MKAVKNLINKENHPQLIPRFKKTERRLLSVFMALLEIVPEFRAVFFEKCEYGSGKTCDYQSFMEPRYNKDIYTNASPDGLIIGQRGESKWAAFVEAKAGKGDKARIRTAQIQDHAELARMLDVPVIIAISNEFARHPSELPYSIAHSKRKGRKIFHFSWADIRTLLALFLDENESITEVERAVVRQCLDFFWDCEGGIQNFDAMPADWSKFVESAGTQLGFGTNTAGVTEIVHGWQQERRDLLGKIVLRTNWPVALKHGAGARASVEECLKFDRKELADQYQLSTTYCFKHTKSCLKILADLRSRKSSVAFEFFPPKGKKAKATVSWLAKAVAEFSILNVKVSFNWKGRKPDTVVSLEELVKTPEMIYLGEVDAPKKIRLILERHDVRRFKNRNRFIEDLESISLELASECLNAELI